MLFSILASSFFLLETFVEDLADPFSGAWTVDAATKEVGTLTAALEAMDA